MSAQIAEAMRLLGSAYRGDWSNFDGRTLRDQLDELSEYLRDPSEPFDLDDWAFSQGVCPFSRSWLERCPETVEGRPYQCQHAETHWVHYSRRAPRGTAMTATKRKYVCHQCGERAHLAIGTLICLPCVDTVTDNVMRDRRVDDHETLTP